MKKIRNFKKKNWLEKEPVTTRHNPSLESRTRHFIFLAVRRHGQWQHDNNNTEWWWHASTNILLSSWWVIYYDKFGWAMIPCLRMILDEDTKQHPMDQGFHTGDYDGSSSSAPSTRYTMWYSQLPSWYRWSHPRGITRHPIIHGIAHDHPWCCSSL